MLSVPGLSAAQVQELIDAALAGKGVIGTAIISIDNADAVTVDYDDGILEGSVGDSTISYSSGVLTVLYSSDGGSQNFPNVTWESSASLTVSISIVSGTGFTATFLNSTTGLSPGTAVDVVRITVSKLSQ